MQSESTSSKPIDEFPNLPDAPIVEAIISWNTPTCQIDNVRNELERRFPDFEISQHQTLGSATLPTGDHPQNLRLEKKESDSLKYVCLFHHTGVVFSELAPYRDWASFESEALRFWEAYAELCQPVEVAKLLVRYISQIKVDKDSPVEDFIEIETCPLDSLKSEGVRRNFFYQNDSYNLNDNYEAVLTRALKHEDSTSGLFVDITIQNTESITDYSSLSQELQTLRYWKNKIFFTVMKNPIENFGGQNL